ncbi:hypothetical protein [Delftia acidovorans]|uniref:Uncharacterized protein n=1 Tax=Delftia acidovorans TaxID=80866 RepID=A0AAJ2V9S4_DELAC|nr:hypothetical protein [Delftia acidovorans]MDX4957269.1 hypothetical protein [Delftia acidovorans]
MNEALKDGGPAYPMADPFVVSTPKNEAEVQRLAQGMSLRDHFAGLAMQGICSLHDQWGWATEDIARGAYEMADLMLRAREKEKS